MNIERIKQCIEMMQGAENLDMTAYQNTFSGKFAKSIEELHACGNTACFAGYLAISDFFREAGGKSDFGSPQLTAPKGGFGPYCEGGRMDQTGTVSFFLDISFGLADAIVYGNPYNGEDLFPEGWRNATPADVIFILERILSGELK